MNIKVTIVNKHCIVQGAPVIVCGNSDYVIEFTFDDEWAQAGQKTARFSYVRDGVRKYKDVYLTGNTVAVPPVYRTRKLQVGVYAGDLVTSTPARIPCEKSVVCDTCTPDDLDPNQYKKLHAKLQEELTAELDEDFAKLQEELTAELDEDFTKLQEELTAELDENITEVVDKLTPAFVETGTVVTCEPVEGHPMGVIAEEGAIIHRCGKNHLNVQGRTIAGAGTFDATTKRPMKYNLLYKGISNTNYYNPSVITSLTHTDSGASFTSTFTGYGIGYAVPIAPGVVYAATSKVVNAAISLCFYQADGTFIHNKTEASSYITAKAPTNAAWCLVVVTAQVAGDASVSDLQVRISSTPAAYEPYIGGAFTYAPGLKIPGLPGVNTIYANSGEITVTGRADPVAIIEKLTSAILALGGNI